jgi:hypothetical protein
MRIWQGNDLRVGIDANGNPYLLDYHLIVSQEEVSILETHTSHGSIDQRQCVGIDRMQVGYTYVASMSIMEYAEDEEYRFTNVDDLVAL